MSNFLSLFNRSRKVNNRFKSWRDLKDTNESPVISYEDWQSKKTDVQNFFRFVRRKMDEEKGLSNKEIIDGIDNLLNRFKLDICNTPSLRSDGIRLDLVNYFMQHKSELMKIYDEYIAREKENGGEISYKNVFTYSSNFEEAKRQYVENMIASYREARDSVTDPETRKLLVYVANATPKQRRDMMSYFNKNEKELILHNKMYFTKNEKEGMEEYFINTHNYLNGKLKRDYAESIKSKLTILKEMGSLDRYINQYNRQMRRFGIPEMEITKEDLIESYINMDEESLAKFSLMQLSCINSFWVNRLTKEIAGFNIGLFLAKSLDLWDRIREAPFVKDIKVKNGYDTVMIPEEEVDYDSDENYIDIPISGDLFDTLDEKIRFLQSRFRYHFTKAKSAVDLESQFSEEIIEDPVTGEKVKRKTAVTVDFMDDLNAEYEEIQDDYEAYFSRINNGVLENAKNNYMEDFVNFVCGENIRTELYTLKDNVLNAQLFSIFNQNVDLKNWGIYLENRENVKNKNMIIIAMDVPGLNMPVRLHVAKSKVMEFIRSNGYSEYFPIYQGEDDFQRGTTAIDYISTPLLMPTTPKYLSKIKKSLEDVKEESRMYYFLKHIESLAGKGEIPEHLKDKYIETKTITVQQGKRKKGIQQKVTREKSVFRKRFYNFNDDKVYVENPKPSRDGQNKYILDEDYLDR